MTGLKGLVVKNTGSQAEVKLENGEVRSCKLRGRLRLEGSRSTTPITVGDYVEVDEGGAIKEICERRNCITRRASNLSKESQVLAANIDYLGIVVSISRPVTETIFIDRMTATAEAYGVTPLIIVNKVDALTPEEVEYKDALVGLYGCIGYPTEQVSALTGQGIAGLIERIKGKVTLLSGHSGVGKSTLINRLLGKEVARTGAISDAHDAGTHTTTFSEMYALPSASCDSTFIIDSPGIKGFGTVGMRSDEVGHYFPDIFKVSHECRFGNCTHTHEPGCAVREAVKKHLIAESRYVSYLNMREDENESRYR